MDGHRRLNNLASESDTLSNDLMWSCFMVKLDASLGSVEANVVAYMVGDKTMDQLSERRI